MCIEELVPDKKSDIMASNCMLPFMGQEGVLFLGIGGSAQHACRIAQNGGDNGARAIGNAERVAVQHIPGILQKAVAHAGHAAAHDDDFRII